MYCVNNIKNDIYWVGGNDRRISLFENVYPLSHGVSYNSYLITDEKTILLDTVDKAISHLFIENLKHVLNGRTLDYVVVNHNEPDHCAVLEDIVNLYPEVKIICNAKALNMIKQFFDFDADSHAQIINEGDTISTGKHNFSFYMAPMVHWPEVMVTYDSTDKILFSADAFGTFGALNGNIFADEVNFERDWLDEARRYYTNIVGKYGAPVQALLKKASGLDIEMICPLHGPIWRENIGWFIDKYQKWSTYTPEDKAVMIAYASVYGNTENAAEILASELAAKGVKNISVYDVSTTHSSVILSESFRCSHLVFMSSTYNGGIFPNMETALLDIKAHALQNRTIALAENGTWAATTGKQMRELLSTLKNMEILENTVSIKSSVKNVQREQIAEMASIIAESLNKL